MSPVLAMLPLRADSVGGLLLVGTEIEDMISGSQRYFGFQQ